jgi:hypothetical protein
MLYGDDDFGLLEIIAISVIPANVKRHVSHHATQTLGQHGCTFWTPTKKWFCALS